MELALIDESLQYLSDGAGTEDKSNIRVQFCQSAPNSNGENDVPVMVGVRKRKNKKNNGGYASKYTYW